MTMLEAREHLRLSCADEAFIRWAALSSAVAGCWREGATRGLQDELAACSGSPADGVFRAGYRFWLALERLAGGDAEGGHEHLLRAVELEAGEGEPDGSRTLGRACVRALIDQERKRARLDEQLRWIEKLEALAEPGRGEDPTPDCLAGMAYEAAGKTGEAGECFRRAADACRPGLDESGMLARRALARLGASPACFLPRQEAVEALARALESGDRPALRRMAVSGDFRVGLGAHWHLADVGEIVSQLIADRRRRPILIAGVEAAETQTRIRTWGWKGACFAGDVDFVLTRSSLGWSWSGVTIGGSPGRYASRLTRPEPETNQPLPFEILAPWDRGPGRQAKTFMAGGIEDLLESPIITESRGILDILSFLPIVGEIARAVNAFLEPVRGVERIRQIAAAARPCGFGLRGFYYNAIASHQGPDAFAIDFTDYDSFLPASDGWPVLAAANGVVGFTRFDVPHSGEPANLVEVTHTHEGRPFLLRYLHLAEELGRGGGVRGPVATGMFIERGGFLGHMDNTGTSVTSHLHFSIHDLQRPHPSGSGSFSVRPTPMNGVELRDGDQSRCLASSNGGPPVAVIVSPLDGAEFPAVTRSVALRPGITGGARPLRVTWTSDLEPRRMLSSRTVFGDGGSVPVVFRARGLHRIRLEVEDALLRRSAAEISVTIINNPPSVAIERPVAGFRIPANDRVVLRGRSFDWEAGGSLRDDQLSWFVDDAPVSTGHRAELSPNTLAPGTRRLRLVGNDGEMQVSDETTFEIVAPASSLAPRVRILSPSNGETFYPTLRDTATDRFVQPITLRGEAVDPETGPVDPDRLLWLITGPDGTVEAGRGASLPFNLRALGFARVAFEIRLEVRDDLGGDPEQVGFDTATVTLDFLI